MKRPSSPQSQDVIKTLRDLGSQKINYPSELLAARRAAFYDQIEQKIQVEDERELTSKDQAIIQILQRLKTLESPYPVTLLTMRRASYRQQIMQTKVTAGFWKRLDSSGTFRFPEWMKSLSPITVLVTAFMVTSVTAFMGFILYGVVGQTSKPYTPLYSSSQLTIVQLTSTPDSKVICKPGYIPPLCLAGSFNKSDDLTYLGNGSARPAVAKDTIPGLDEIHKAAFINDGLYGPGASWISNSPNSWIKIDLGQVTTINTVTFGRDRLGQLNDRDPGQFMISVALADNAYADGNSSMDDVEYVEVFDSEAAGFNGVVSGAETVTAQFMPLEVRFVKITFENAGTAIDEVEVFNLQPFETGILPTGKPQDNLPWNTPTSLATNTSLPVPIDTAPVTLTPLPTSTPTPIPTDTPSPTTIPTDDPTPTDTPVPDPIDTLMPFDTPPPIETEPPPTATPILDINLDTLELRQGTEP